MKSPLIYTVVIKEDNMPKLESKPLNWFKTAPQARRHFDEAELRLLGESLKVRQLQPVLARSDGTLIAVSVGSGREPGRARMLEVEIEEEPTERVASSRLAAHGRHSRCGPDRRREVERLMRSCWA